MSSAIPGLEFNGPRVQELYQVFLEGIKKVQGRARGHPNFNETTWNEKKESIDDAIQKQFRVMAKADSGKGILVLTLAVELLKISAKLDFFPNDFKALD